MANLKNIMVESLRKGTELDTEWRLRKSFLLKNLNVNDSGEYKDHLIVLSHCFVSTALGKPHDYPPNVVQEANSRSWGLKGSVQRAMYEMQDTSYQSTQVSKSAAASSFYQRPNVEIPYNYNPDQSAQQNMYDNSGQDFTATRSYYHGQGKKGQASAMGTPYGSAGNAGVASYGQGQKDFSLNQNQKGAFPQYVQNQRASAMHDQNDRGSASYYPSDPMGQGHTGSDSYYPNYPNPSSMGPNDHQSCGSYYPSQSKSSSIDHNSSQGSITHASSYDRSYPPSYNNQKQHVSFSSHAQNEDSLAPSYGYGHQEMPSSYNQRQQDSASFGQNQQSPSSSWGVSGGHPSLLSSDSRHQDLVLSQGRDQHGKLSSFGQRDKDCGSFGRSRDMSPHSQSTQYVHQDPSSAKFGHRREDRTEMGGAFPKVPSWKERIVDSNALSVIPVKKGHPNKGFPNPKKKKKCPWRSDKRKRSLEVAAAALKFVKSNANRKKGNPGVMKPQEVAKYQRLESCFKLQPLFDSISSMAANSTSASKDQRPVTSNSYNTRGNSKDVSDRKDASAKSVSPSNRSVGYKTPTADSGHSTKETIGPNGDKTRGTLDVEMTPNKKKGNPSPEHTKEDDSKHTMQKLVPILDMANYYSSLDKGCVDPYATLQKCAASAKQKVSCVSKPSVKPDGSKEIMCSIFANDVSLVSVVLIGGTSPDEAKKRLATAVLERIALPHLRLVSNGEGGLKLEGSNTAFARSEARKSEEKKEVDSSNQKKPTAHQDRTQDKTRQDRTQNNTRQDRTQDKTRQDRTQDKTRQTFKTPKNSTTTSQKKFSPASTAATMKSSDFDSYVAWKCERHPGLKNVRKLGHMYATLPFKKVGTNPEDKVSILQMFANVGGIELEIQEHEESGPFSGNKYSVVMDGKIALFSWNTGKEPLDIYISKTVLNKVCMPYLRLVDNCLQASTKPFNDRPGCAPAGEVILDTWQTGNFIKHRNKPVRVNDYCIFQISKLNAVSVFDESAQISQKKSLLKTALSLDGIQRYTYLTLDGQIVGGCIQSVNEKGTKKSTKASATQETIRNLRKCHWTISNLKLSDEKKFIYPSDLFPDLKSDAQSESKELKDSNKGHQLLAKMGWTGGGIGRRGDGIEEPISSSQFLSSNPGMGHKKAAGPSNISKMADISQCNNKELLQSYHNSIFHRPLFIICPFGSERGKIFNLAFWFRMNASTRGLQRNKRVVVTKEFDARTLVTDCLTLGGKSDQYELIPPQEVDMEMPMDFFFRADLTIKEKQATKRQKKKEKKAMAKGCGDGMPDTTPTPTVFGGVGTGRESKGIQCHMIEAPRLVRWKPAQELCDIVYDVEDREGKEEGSENNDEEQEDGCEVDDCDEEQEDGCEVDDCDEEYEDGCEVDDCDEEYEEYYYMDEEGDDVRDENEEEFFWNDDPLDRKRKHDSSFDSDIADILKRRR